jgi:hypothetical protein
MQQDFAFAASSPERVAAFLESFYEIAVVEKRADDFYLFAALPGTPEFTVDAWILDGGIRSSRSGHYFSFLGAFLEAMTGEFGRVAVSDSWATDGPIEQAPVDLEKRLLAAGVFEMCVNTRFLLGDEGPAGVAAKLAYALHNDALAALEGRPIDMARSFAELEALAPRVGADYLAHFRRVVTDPTTTRRKP